MPLKLLLMRGSRSKSARASPQQCTQSAPDFIQIGSLSAERVNTEKIAPERKSNIWPKPSFEPNNN